MTNPLSDVLNWVEIRIIRRLIYYFPGYIIKIALFLRFVVNGRPTPKRCAGDV